MTSDYNDKCKSTFVIESCKSQISCVVIGYLSIINTSSADISGHILLSSIAGVLGWMRVGGGLLVIMTQPEGT